MWTSTSNSDFLSAAAFKRYMTGIGTYSIRITETLYQIWGPCKFNPSLRRPPPYQVLSMIFGEKFLVQEALQRYGKLPYRGETIFSLQRSSKRVKATMNSRY